MKVPVLLLAWRRPELTKQVIASIRRYAPDQIYVACDGPNPDREGEVRKVAQTREVIDAEIDWPCEIHRRYSESNFGCRLGVSSAISWFFDSVKEGIVIEDDCIASPFFYKFCEKLLSHYRDDPRICCISGTNFQSGIWRSDGTYYFSRYNHCWGWASWKTAWDEGYDANLEAWTEIRHSKLLHDIFSNPAEVKYWTAICDSMLSAGIPDSWATRWFIGCAIKNRLTAIPNRNLVVNIGFGENATHCSSYSLNMVSEDPVEEFCHPRYVLRNAQADEYTFQTIYLPTSVRNLSFFERKLRNVLDKINKKVGTWRNS